MGGTFDPFKEMRTNITTENGRLKDKLAALEIKYSEAVELLGRATKQCICNQLLFDIRDLLKRHKGE